jgi:hypothetical protein
VEYNKTLRILFSLTFVVAAFLGTIQPNNAHAQSFPNGIYVNDEANPIYLSFQEFRSLDNAQKKELFKNINKMHIVVSGLTTTFANVALLSNAELSTSFDEVSDQILPYEYGKWNQDVNQDEEFKVIGIN